jgi:hypothetical protein
VTSQEERGLGYRNYVERAASTDYIVGIEWFTLVDASRTGVAYAKYGGENPNDGIFSVVDRPWKQMIAHMVKTNYAIYPLMMGQQQPFVYDNPKFTFKSVGNRVAGIPRATGPIKLDGGNVNWPGTPAEQVPTSRLVDGATSGGVEASFKLCWDNDNLYVTAIVTDPTPMMNENRPASIWAADGIELFIGGEKIDQNGAVLFTDRQILLAASKEPKFFFSNAPHGDTSECTVATLPNVDGNGYTLQAAIPFKSLGFQPKEGQIIRFDIGIDDSSNGKSRLRQLMWNGTNRNSGDRTGWGRARFVN